MVDYAKLAALALAAAEEKPGLAAALGDLDKHLRPVRGADFLIWKRDEELALLLLLYSPPSRVSN